MTISEGENTLGTLVLQDANGNFSGELTTAPSEDGVNLTATIATNEGSTVISSIESIPDLIKQCAHTYKGTFRYKTDDIVALTDDKAYIEIIMSPLQHKVDVTIDDENQNFIMSNDGKVWIAIDGGAKFVTNFTDEVVSSAGKILTINRKGFVDLGISDGILWADENVSGGEGTNIDGNWYYTFEQAQAFGADNLPTSGRDITDNKSYPYTDFYNLLNQCCWDFVVDEDDNFLGYNVYKAKVDDDKGKKSDRTIITMAHYLSGLYFKGGKYDASQEPHIFLPANGFIRDENLLGLGEKGIYWSGTACSDGYKGFSLYLGEDNDIFSPYYEENKQYKVPVRLVMRK